MEKEASKSSSNFYYKCIQSNAIYLDRISFLIGIIKDLEQQKNSLEDSCEKLIFENKDCNKKLAKYEGSVIYQIEKFAKFLLGALYNLFVNKKNKKNKKMENENSMYVKKNTPPYYLCNTSFSNVFDWSKPEDSYVLVRKEPMWVSGDCYNEEYVDINIKCKINEDESGNKDKLLLLRVRFYDEKCEYIKGDYSGLVNSRSVGNYKYLKLTSNQELHSRIPIPTGASIITLGVQEWDNRERVFVKNAPFFNVLQTQSKEIVTKAETLSYREGVSILMPSYSGLHTIAASLQSILDQDIDKKLLQLIVIVNGVDDGTVDFVSSFARSNPEISVVCEFVDLPGASNARNVAIDFANRKYTIFLDDDDILGKSYISSLYALASQDSIVVTGICDFKEEGVYDDENSINKQIKEAEKLSSPTIHSVTSAITMIACKLLPTHQLKKIRFNQHLKSGEDVVYFSDYVTRFSPSIKVAKIEKNNSYFRRLRENSISRREMSFDFYVQERLDVIAALSLLLENLNDDSCRGFVLSKIKAQSGFVKKYINSNPTDIHDVKDAIRTKGVGSLVYPVLNSMKADTLVFSYCFSPFVDTSAVVAAKRMREFGSIFDVVYNDMSTVREKSDQMNWLSEDLIENRFEIKTPTSFGSWESIEQFSEESIKIVGNRKYKKIYSRVLWPASHFAAFMYKIKNPKVRWVAEFSDPVMWDLKGNQRTSPVLDSSLKKEIYLNLKKRKVSIDRNADIYFLCELLPYVFADEILFTCNNQMEYMLDKFPLSSVVNSVRKKAVVCKHPTLDSKFYELTNPKYELSSDKINIGYFGAFYESRGIGEFLSILSSLDFNNRKNILIHIFTENKSDCNEIIKKLGVYDNVVLNDYVEYYDFLSISKRFDYLLVNDAKVSTILGCNPYLPSKISDYLGSGSKILALCEKESAMSKMAGIDHCIFLEDEFGIRQFLINYSSRI